jgi:pimeloyl-ACP methyl ester carboxylesterase
MSRGKQVSKVVLSSVILTALALFVLIGRKQALFAQKEYAPFPSVSSVNPAFLKANEFGAIISQGKDNITHATVEHIMLHVPKTSNSDEKIVRYGRLVRYPSAKATILICHGFMTDKFDVAFLRHMFPQGRFNFVTFDFRAHGENCEGQRCTFGRDEALDVATVARFIKNHPQLKAIPLIVYAFSMGAVASIEAQAQDDTLFKAMILDCPFDSTENIIKKSLENMKFTFLGYDFSIPACNLLQKYVFHPYVQALIKGILKTVATLDTKNIDVRIYPISPVESIQKVHVPCFFIHCKNDEKITVEAVKSVYSSADTDYKVLWLTNGRRHFDSYFYNPERYVKEIRAFIDKAVNGLLEQEKVARIIEDPDELLVQI